MANYNVDIELAVKGQTKLKSLERELAQLQKLVNEINKPIDATPGITKRKKEIQLAKDLLNVEKAIKRERAGRTAELAREARLIALQRKEQDRIAAQRQRGLTQYNPFPNVAAGVPMGIGPEPDLQKLQRRAEIFDRIAKNRAQNLEREKAFKRLALESGRTIAQNVGEQRAEAREIERKSDAQRKLNRLFEDANKIRASFNQDRIELAQQRRQRFTSMGTNALIGGGFPLLFGQGGAAAAGGAFGGLAGGAVGGQAGFAFSIIGTAIGQAVAEAEAFNKELAALNANSVGLQTSALATSKEVENLGKMLGIAKLEALEVLKAFSAFEDFADKKALAAIFGDDAAAFNRLAAANTELKLAQEIFEARNKIGNVEAQKLLDQLKGSDLATVELALAQARLEAEHKVSVEKARQVGFADYLIAAAAALRGEFIDPASFAEDRVQTLEDLFAESSGAFLESFKQSLKEIRTLSSSVAGFDTNGPGTGKTDPTINLQKRLNILEKQISAEQQVLGLTAEAESIVKRKLSFEARIAQIQETGVAERKRLTEQEDIALSKSVETAAITFETLKYEREMTALIERQNKAGQKLLEPLEKKIDTLRDRNAFEREYGDLIKNGSTPAAAKQTIEAQKQIKEIEKLVEKQLESNAIHIENLRILVDQTRGTKAHAGAVDALNRALERRNEIEEKGRIAKGEVQGAKTPAERIEDEKIAIQEVINDLNDPIKQLTALANTLGNAFSESFKGIISGSMTAREALANLFQRTADHFLDMAAQMIAAQIQMQILNIGMNFLGGFGVTSGPGVNLGKNPNFFNQGPPPLPPLPGKALGGQVGAGRPYIVGERGPEMFVPGAQGNIVPNNAMGSTSIVVNVDASGSSVEGEAEQSRQLGKMLGAAVQAELVKQKRPGGLLAT